jgi:hypothetical protein
MGVVPALKHGVPGRIDLRNAGKQKERTIK